jgi:YVTN family beta-propeller protein
MTMGRSTVLDLAAGQDVARFAFVIGERTNEVVAIDTRTDALAARLPLSGVPKQLFVLEDARQLVAALGDAKALELVDLGGGPGDLIELGHDADHMQYRPDIGLLAVAGVAAGELTLIDLRERRVRRRQSGLGQPTSMIFGGGGHLLVADGGSNEIAVIDIAQDALDRLDVTADGGELLEPPGISHLARTPNGWLGFAVAAAVDGPVIMIDLQRPRTANRLSRGRGPSRSFPTPNNSFLIVPNNGDKTISLHAMASRTEVARLAGTSGMAGVAMGWFDTTAFISSAETESLLVLDLVNRMRAGNVPVPGRPGLGTSTPDGLKLYVPLIDTGQVAVIDTRTRSVAKVVDAVGQRPWSIQIAGPLAYCH